jgi:hypothetical protein
MSRKSLKQWLIAANGWQRIWFVCSLITILYYAIIYPIQESNKGSSFRYQMLWAAEREMKNPLCGTYMQGDFGTLIEPKYSEDGSTCYNIFVHRKYLEGNKSITESSFNENFKKEERERWLMHIGIGLLISTMFSALLYGLGVIVAWIIKGFKGKESK